MFNWSELMTLMLKNASMQCSIHLYIYIYSSMFISWWLLPPTRPLCVACQNARTQETDSPKGGKGGESDAGGHGDTERCYPPSGWIVSSMVCVVGPFEGRQGICTWSYIWPLDCFSTWTDLNLLHLVLINNDEPTLRHSNPMSFVYLRSSIARELCRCHVCRVLTNTWELALHALMMHQNPPKWLCLVASSGSEWHHKLSQSQWKHSW